MPPSALRALLRAAAFLSAGPANAAERSEAREQDQRPAERGGRKFPAAAFCSRLRVPIVLAHSLSTVLASFSFTNLLLSRAMTDPNLNNATGASGASDSGTSGTAAHLNLRLPSESGAQGPAQPTVSTQNDNSSNQATAAATSAEGAAQAGGPPPGAQPAAAAAAPPVNPIPSAAAPGPAPAPLSMVAPAEVLAAIPTSAKPKVIRMVPGHRANRFAT